MKFKNMLDLFSKKSEDLGAKGSFAIARNDGESVIQRAESEESHDKEVLRFTQDDGTDIINVTLNIFQGLIAVKTRHFDKMLKQVQHDNFSCAERTEKVLPSNLLTVLTTLKKCAFTLAEVLITLAIIGVVAAMTLPTLIQNHQKQTYVNGLKKAMNTTTNMFKKMQADEEVSSFANTKLFTDGVCAFNAEYLEYLVDCYGNLIHDEGWANRNGCEDWYGNPSVFENIIPKYMKVVKICKNTECNVKYNFADLNCNENDCKLYKDGQSMSIDSKADDGNFKHSTLGFYTADGMIFYMSLRDGGWINIFVDVNGEKGPNIKYRDLFELIIKSNGEILSSGGTNYSKYIEYLISNGWKMDY